MSVRGGTETLRAETLGVNSTRETGPRFIKIKDAMDDAPKFHRQ